MRVPRWVVLSLIVVGVGCGSATGPSTPTPAPTPTPNTSACAGELKPMTSFTANPTTITEGDAFTLSWAAPCGLVSLAQKGSAQFLQGQPSTGSHELKTGANGYPTAPGETVYEATNGDVGKRLDVTVTVIAKATPTPTPEPGKPTVSLSPASGTTCHPTKSGGVVTPCNVAFTASGTNYTSLAWSGCCAGSSGTSGACRVNDITTTFTCTVTATGAGGNATANGTANGVNTAPIVGGPTDYPGYTPPLPLDTNRISGWFDGYDPDGDGVTCDKTFWCGGPCASIDSCGTSYHPRAHASFDTTHPAGTCCWAVRFVDDWGAATNGPNNYVDVQ